MVEVGTWSLHVKSAPRKKTPIKNSTVIDRESDSLSITVEFFLIAVFFSWCIFTCRLMLANLIKATVVVSGYSSTVSTVLQRHGKSWSCVMVCVQCIQCTVCTVCTVYTQRHVRGRARPTRAARTAVVHSCSRQLHAPMDSCVYTH